MITQFFSNEPELLAFAARLANVIENGAIIFLYGSLGAGKTTFTRGFLRALNYHGKVKSPTYTLVESYELAGRKIFHFDFYRLNNAKELEHVGIQEYFSETSICLIEWPEKGEPLLPKPDLSCYISIKDQGRELRVEAYSERGERILKRLGKKTCNV